MHKIYTLSNWTERFSWQLPNKGELIKDWRPITLLSQIHKLISVVAWRIGILISGGKNNIPKHKQAIVDVPMIWWTRKTRMINQNASVGGNHQTAEKRTQKRHWKRNHNQRSMKKSGVNKLKKKTQTGKFQRGNSLTKPTKSAELQKSLNWNSSSSC